MDELKRQLLAAGERERKWLEMAVSLAKAKAPTWEVDGAWARHAQASANTRHLVRQLASALLAPDEDVRPVHQERSPPAAGGDPSPE